MMHITQSNNSKNTCIRVWQNISNTYALLLDKQVSERNKLARLNKLT